MRLKSGLLVSALALSGCTASPLDGMNRIAVTAEAEPYPANYRDLLQHQYGLNRPTDLSITEPRQLPAANALDPARWYVCVRTNTGAQTIHVIARGRLEGTIRIPPTAAKTEPQPNLCDGGTYGPLG